MIDEVIGLCKAYTTRVGEGPFPTEISGPQGDELRTRGHEFGTITGRPRRCGWFDAMAMKRAVRISGIDSAIITKLDVLSGQTTLKVCTGYRTRGGEPLDDLPALVYDFEQIVPEYIELDGWSEDLSGVRRWEDLPASVQRYVREVSRLIECPVSFVSVGPGREATIAVEPSRLLRGFLG
jgi:adenylosuccinate synthase